MATNVNALFLKDLPSLERAKHAEDIAQSPTWNKLGLQFEVKYHFTITEAYLKATYTNESTIQLCGHLLDLLCNRNIPLVDFIAALEEIGMDTSAKDITDRYHISGEAVCVKTYLTNN